MLKNKAEEGRTISIFRSARGNLIALKNKKKTKLQKLKKCLPKLKKCPHSTLKKRSRQTVEELSIQFLLSMTTLLSHTFTHFTGPSFMLKTKMNPNKNK